VVAIDAATVFVATDDYIASFRRDALPAKWWRELREAVVNGQVAAVIAHGGVPAETPFSAVPALEWPASAVATPGQGSVPDPS
jgi:secreted protein with Ig-like and vWFA domain